MVVTEGFIPSAISLTLSVLSIAGLVFMTQFAFYSKEQTKGKHCVTLSEKSGWAMWAVKAAVVLMWLQLLFAVGSTVVSAVGGYRSEAAEEMFGPLGYRGV